MDVFEAIRKRRSVRQYKDGDVDDNLIGVILWAGSQAPSAGNMKEWKFVVIKDKKKKELLFEASLKQDHVKNAPVVIVVGVDVHMANMKYGIRGERVYAIEDASAAIENMLLAATALGLGACWIGALDEEEVRNIVGFPESIRPIALITIGYPDEEVEEKEIDFTRFCFYENYGNSYRPKIKTLEDVIRETIEKINKIKNKNKIGDK